MCNLSTDRRRQMLRSISVIGRSRSLTRYRYGLRTPQCGIDWPAKGDSMRQTGRLGLVLLALSLPAAVPAADSGKKIPLRNGAGGVGLDDMKYAAGLSSVVVPAGRTGRIDLIDPESHALTSISGFSTAAAGTGHGEGTTSADEGDGFLF